MVAERLLLHWSLRAPIEICGQSDDDRDELVRKPFVEKAAQAVDLKKQAHISNTVLRYRIRHVHTASDRSKTWESAPW
jgi:hypothetical protein